MMLPSASAHSIAQTARIVTWKESSKLPFKTSTLLQSRVNAILQNSTHAAQLMILRGHLQ